MCSPRRFLPLLSFCEGASEVGLVRGIDQFRAADQKVSISGLGVALVDGGGDTSQVFRRARAFRSLGYQVAVLRDDDVRPDQGTENTFKATGGQVIAWRNGRALEDELFLSLSSAAVTKLVEYAIELHGEDLIDAHIKSASEGRKDLTSIRSDMLFDEFSTENRQALGKAARTKSGWFKTVGRMEEVARRM